MSDGQYFVSSLTYVYINFDMLMWVKEWDTATAGTVYSVHRQESVQSPYGYPPFPKLAHHVASVLSMNYIFPIYNKIS